MGFISIVLIGIMALIVVVIGIPIIVIIFSIIVSLLTILFSSLVFKGKRSYLLGIKTFITTCSALLGAGFGFLIVNFVVSFNMSEVDTSKYFIIYSVAFSVIGLVIGLLFALLVNKKIVDPLYAFSQKFRKRIDQGTPE